MTVRAALAQLKARGSARNVAGMRRFGIRGKKMYGVSVADIRAIGKKIPRNHGLALRLWRTGVHEARILASIVDEPARVTQAQAEVWVRQFDSWDVCDQVCLNLFDKMPFAFRQAVAWSGRKEEFVKRAGFSLMACLAWHDRMSADQKFLPFLRAILKQSTDSRPFVRKAMNWALRQIGKRNRPLNVLATHAADLLRHSQDNTARRIGRDAYRELTSAAVRKNMAARVPHS